MSELSPALLSATQQPRVLIFGSVVFGFASGTVRLLDGSGEVIVGGVKFSGRDSTWGAIDTIKGLGDQSGDQAPVVTVGVIPSSTASVAALSDPSLQGTPVAIQIGSVDTATGLPIGDSYVLFLGQIDNSTVRWADHDRRVDIRCIAAAEKLFAIEEGLRLSDTFHQTVWPGELGMEFVTGVEDWVPWGQQVDFSKPQIRTDHLAAGVGLARDGGGYTYLGGLYS